MLMRSLLAFVALPGVVAFAVPLLLARPWEREEPFWLPAVLPLAAGLALLFWCVREFSVSGRGTLAPWQPPVRLVTSGPYRLSRNPMYLAVLLILAGWAMGFGSAVLLAYAAIVLIAFVVRVMAGEEPALARTHREAWRRYAARTPRWLFPHRKALLLTSAALLVALPIGGLIYEALAEARDAREFPPPGMLVDVGGFRLHLLCIGEGEPLVVFEGSQWGSALDAAETRDRIARRTTVCSYDRRGRGWSDPGAGAATIGALARDLAVLQDRAKLRGPSVVVASSLGGLTAEMFARQFPERVAGLILLDAGRSDSLPRLAAQSSRLQTAACAGGVLARLGVIRLTDPFELIDGTDAGRRAAGMNYSAAAWQESCALAEGLADSQREFAAAPPLPADMRLTVLSADSSGTALPPPARGVFDIDRSRLIADSQPEAVIDAVFDMLDDIR